VYCNSYYYQLLNTYQENQLSVVITESSVKPIVQSATPTEIKNAMPTCHLPGIAWPGKLVTTFQKNAFPSITAALMRQVGLMVNTRLSRKE